MLFEDNTFDATPPIERYLAELLVADIAGGNPWQITSNPPSYKYVKKLILIPVGVRNSKVE